MNRLYCVSFGVGRNTGEPRTEELRVVEGRVILPLKNNETIVGNVPCGRVGPLETEAGKATAYFPDDQTDGVPLRRWALSRDGTRAAFYTPNENEAYVAEKTVAFVLEHHRPIPNSYPDCMM